jgi:hypothetical protein
MTSSGPQPLPTDLNDSFEERDWFCEWQNAQIDSGQD